jgi:hypothetical protein
MLFAAEYLQRNFTPVVEENTTLIDVPKKGEAVTVDLAVRTQTISSPPVDGGLAATVRNFTLAYCTQH